MSVKSTITYTREQAINTIVNKRIEPIIKELKTSLEYLTNKDLADLLNQRYYDSEFDDYEVIDKEEK